MSATEMECPICQDTNCLVRSSIGQSRVYQCEDCDFAFCHPVPEFDSDSSGPISVTTAEDYTAGILAKSGDVSLIERYARLRHERFTRELGKENYRMLEVGCGTASMMEAYIRLGVDYNGIDIDPRVVRSVKQRTTEAEDRIRCVDLMDLVDGEPFDVIWFSQVLEHIKTPRAFVKKVWEMLGHQGLVCGDVPNHYSLSGYLHRLLHSNPNRFGGIEVPHHVFSYTKKSLERLFAPQFKVDVFAVNPNHRVFGQPKKRTIFHQLFFGVSGPINAQSMLVFLGRKMAAEDRCPSSKPLAGPQQVRL